MSAYALAFTLVFIAITIFVSMWQKLGLEREITIGTIRSSIQLLLVGYVLHFIFHTDAPILIVLIVGVMITVASWNASQRGKGLSGIRWRIALSITVTEGLIMVLLLSLRIIEPTPQYIIPISGMTIGNAMVVSSLFLNQMKRDVQSSKGEIEALLSLGANVRQSIQDCMKRAVKASMIPTIDGMKTVGLVQLPGMMTGMIVAGADPVEAVRYQILIMFAFTSSAGITSILLSLLSYKLWFTKKASLRSL
ncbi:iron export ABC transporter permease subunit FetB [Paenibacillus chondroitinus]|uniref:Iron export ABC transporter permease subunit FetB n=1 Tax=Paenibacillus chondroitinus TaxID=59842 RepID=A0ABU6DNH3_9BACL|nr:MULTISPECIES: iron export ABC transporter permease subunit FetB [Paenibacillus]MCY9660572.1 iron export ABC transporter permease subunit FetB [Paenibacillus anseongense]MEB4799332.1 iron export ABC transporter permease subunit FetB [Paenibacillus chondroitinus]